MAVNLKSCATRASLARASGTASGQRLPPTLDAVQWRLAFAWLDRIEATESTSDRRAVLRGLCLNEPATAIAVAYLLDLRRRMDSAAFLALAWPPVIPRVPAGPRKAPVSR